MACSCDGNKKKVTSPMPGMPLMNGKMGASTKKLTVTSKSSKKGTRVTVSRTR